MAANFFNLRDFLLNVANNVRQLPTDLGVRLYTVTVRVTTYDNSGLFNVPGMGVPTVTETPIYLDGYGTLPYVRSVTKQDIIASGGTYQDGDYKIDFITPYYNNIYGAGGVAINIFEPNQNPGTQPTEIVFIIQGPEFPTNGALFKKINTYSDKPFHYTLFLRKIGVNA